MKKITLLFNCILLTLLGCSGETNSTDKENTADERSLPEMTQLPMIKSMEKAMNVDAFKSHEAVQFDIKLFFGGNLRLEGTITSTTNSDRVRLDKKDGTTLVYDGKKVYQSPADVNYPGARFDMFTWQYFFMAPFKFSDPGTNWEDLEDKNYNGKAQNTAKLTFDKGTGDAPDDWYIAFQDKQTRLLSALAYIVTFNKSQEEAEEEPHAITYHNYKKVDGIPFANEWQFWIWTEEAGFGEKLGKANISNVKFIEPSNDFFELEGTRKEITL